MATEFVWVIYRDTDLESYKSGVFPAAAPGTNRLMGTSYAGLATHEIIAVISPAFALQTVFVANSEITFSR